MFRFVVRHPFLSTFIPLGLFVLLVQVQTVRLLAERRLAESAVAFEDLGAVGDFTFVGRDGKPVTQADFAGKVWACSCFFTCCTETCPQLSGVMARLQHELASEPDVRLVSLTVDPDHDNPAVLDRYARSFGADPSRWIFMTGEYGDVTEFIRKRLLLAVEKNGPDAAAGSRMLHSNKLTVVDRAGRIRGHFDGTDPADVAKLRNALIRLAGEP